MRLGRTTDGLEAELRISGFARLSGAAFLGIWLAFWTLFEVAVLVILALGLWSLITGQPLARGRGPISLGTALPAGLFMLFWLTFWTFGGLAAAREFLRLLFGRDRLAASFRGLEVLHSSGLFSSRREIGREEIRRFYRQPSGRRLCVETAHGTLELTRLGTPSELEELEAALSEEFRLQRQPEPGGALPKGWSEVVSPERDSVLVKDPVVRRKQALVMWLVCALVASGALYLTAAAFARPNLWPVALVVDAVASAAAWSAVWLSLGRNEWRLDKGRLVLQRRFGMNQKRRFEAVSLEVAEDHSGEGEPSYDLNAVSAGDCSETSPQNSWKHRRNIHRQSGDPTEPRNFGLWLSHRCQLPLVDRTTPEAKAKELDALMEKLASSGRLGRIASGVLRRIASSRQPPKA